jgi:hypothetical protein
VHESDEVIERVARTLRGDVMAVAPDFDARVMGRIREEARTAASPRIWQWMTRPRTIRVSPLAGLALAAGLAAVVVMSDGNDRSQGPATAARGIATPPSVPAGEQLTRFVFVNRSASRVALLGDFNDWDEGKSLMQRVGTVQEGVWEITIPLAPGRYHYTFVVDGKTWVADSLAPRTLEDDFGRPNSLITVGDATT